MNDLKKNFIEFTLNHEILRFGNFTLKSGRESPYFFNTGLCCDGKLLRSLSEFYASYISENIIDYDYIFGPAYKGITLASSISMSLERQHDINKPFSYNRKESKSHGEKGVFVGFQPNGSALIIDDVISSGSSIRECIELLTLTKTDTFSVLVAFDRMEIGNKIRASSELTEEYSLKVHSIIDLEDILSFIISDEKYQPYIDSMKKYIDQYKK